jgi:hypothetical protein
MISDALQHGRHCCGCEWTQNRLNFWGGSVEIFWIKNSGWDFSKYPWGGVYFPQICASPREGVNFLFVIMG